MRKNGKRYQVNPEGIVEVQCSMDKEFWPATLEFFFKDKRKSNGLMPMCKACYLDKYDKKRKGIYYKNYWNKRKGLVSVKSES